METKLVGTLAHLPDGQRVKIEIVHDDSYATVRRIDGEWAGTIAVCAVNKIRNSGSVTTEDDNLN